MICQFKNLVIYLKLETIVKLKKKIKIQPKLKILKIPTKKKTVYRPKIKKKRM